MCGMGFSIYRWGAGTGPQVSPFERDLVYLGTVLPARQFTNPHWLRRSARNGSGEGELEGVHQTWRSRGRSGALYGRLLIRAHRLPHDQPRDRKPSPPRIYEIAEFGREALAANIRYLGVCCGGGPHHIRALAEALGRRPPASRFSPDMSKHYALPGPTPGSSPKIENMPCACEPSR